MENENKTQNVLDIFSQLRCTNDALSTIESALFHNSKKKRGKILLSQTFTNKFTIPCHSEDQSSPRDDDNKNDNCFIPILDMSHVLSLPGELKELIILGMHAMDRKTTIDMEIDGKRLNMQLNIVFCRKPDKAKIYAKYQEEEYMFDFSRVDNDTFQYTICYEEEDF